MKLARRSIRSLLLGIFWRVPTEAFVVGPRSSSSTLVRTRSTTKLYSTTPRKNHAVNESRRKVLLARRGPHFRLERMSGSIEFGATANLLTQLEGIDGKAPTSESVAAWLEDERGLALSIWDPNLMNDLGNSIYRLEIMKLQFVTLQLKPWVDVQMKTVTNEQQQPIFTLQSVAFDPNIEVLPGMRINADSLGIVIEVAGLLGPSADGRSVTGGISFQTTGNLPPPMRILPEPVLKATSDAINNTLVNFAIQSFQKGAKANFKEFLIRRRRETQQ